MTESAELSELVDFSSSKVHRPSTRSSTEVWLVGQMIPILDLEHFKQLPTAGQVLQRLFFDLKTNKLSLPTSCSNVTNEIMLLWHAANIPTKQKPNIVSKLKDLYQKHVNVSKNGKRPTDKQRALENEFCGLLKSLFDVSHADSEKRIRIEEDRQFLKDQRSDRKMAMGEEDHQFKRMEASRQKRKHAEFRRQESAQQKTEKATISRTYAAISENEEEWTTADETDDEIEVSSYHQQLVTPASLNNDKPQQTSKISPKIYKRCLIENPLFIASLDRTGTTPRQAMHIVAPALKAVGVNVDDLTLCTTSIYQARKKIRCSIGEEVREKFRPETPLVAHFDGKLLPDQDGVNSDRMPVVVSGINIEKLLAIPKLPGSGTGVLMGNTTVELLRQWEGVPNWLAGLCFDTTSANTGVHNGAITIIQEAFDKRLLFLACRHHIHEIIASAIFDVFFVSSGPRISIFGRFKDQWPYIDQDNYASIRKKTEGFILTESEKTWLEQNQKSWWIFF